MALPFLPGQVFDRKLGKDKFHKSHCFDYMNDVSVHVGETKQGIGGERMPGGKQPAPSSKYPTGEGSQAPAWVAFDRQVLCFDAYFKEAVHEKREETYRIRKCKIYFYLEDDSIQIIESKVENSGIPQGTHMRRHRVPLPSPNDDKFYVVDHFNVGEKLEIYSKVYHLTSCDEFTKNFLSKLGVKVKSRVPTPDDPYTKHRKEEQDTMQPLRPYEKEDTRRQFLENDRRVLRFTCYWDDTDCMFGDTRIFEMHYFLADDTLQFIEKVPNNSGRDSNANFIKRDKLPKQQPPMKQPGVQTDRTVLNVFGPMGLGGRYILDSLKTGAVHVDYYHHRDFTIGSYINAWGRKMLICSCDEFTQEFYKSTYGLTDASFKPIDFEQRNRSPVQREIPPYNGFGSEEDSLCNCLSLIAKPPRRDFIKFMEKDRHGLESNVLRFVARMDTSKPINCDRVFIISYFLSDDTVLIFEPPIRNSGIVSGKFNKRDAVKKPDGETYYKAPDLYIGAIVTLNGVSFKLIDADEYAVNYMEKNAAEFPQACINSVRSKLKQNLNEDMFRQLQLNIEAQDRKKIGTIGFDAFKNVIQNITGDLLSTHEIMTVARHYSNMSDNSSDDCMKIIARAQEVLRKANWEDFSLMQDRCIYMDQGKQEGETGHIGRKELENICKSFKLPIVSKPDLLQKVLDIAHRDASGNIDFHKFIQSINWRDNPVAAQRFVPSQSLGEKVSSASGPSNIESISYSSILADLK